MINNKKIVVVMPAYNAAKTLRKTYAEIPFDIVDQVVLVDDDSQDETLRVAENLSLIIIEHNKNIGYGGNQKTCYKSALDLGADIVIMLHPDYQYDPKLIKPMVEKMVSEDLDLILGSRILNGQPLASGMPVYKYFANRFLTKLQNIIFQKELSEYHTGYRAYTNQFLKQIPFEINSDDFLFDNQILIQAIHWQKRIGELPCPTKYEPDSSSIKLKRSFVYGIGVLWNTVRTVLHQKKIIKYKILQKK